MERLKKILEANYIGRTTRDLFEFLEDFIVLILSILLFFLSIVAILDIGYSIFSQKSSFIELIPKFLYIFILIELFRLMIVYLTERRIDTSMVVKTTFIAILREVIIKAPHLKFEDYIGISILIAVLGVLYYVPKLYFTSEKDFSLKRNIYKIKKNIIRKD